MSTDKVDKPTVLAFWGSNSSQSINGRLLRFTASLFSKVNVKVIDLRDFSLPLFGVDLEREQGHPEEAKALKKLIKESDGILMSLAEHNGGYTAFFKNALDWISRLEGKAWENKPIFLMGASDGRRGARSVITMAENRIPFNGGRVIHTFSFPTFHENFSGDEVTNEELLSNLKELVDSFEKKILEENNVLSEDQLFQT